MRLLNKIKTFFFNNFPSIPQWKRFSNSLSKKEKNLFILFLSLAIISAVFLNVNFYLKNTQVLPTFGGEHKEGLIGQPRFINPLYLSDNDSDRDLVEILFSGLLKFDGKGEIVKDLSSDYQIKNNGKDYEFTLKDNVLWHDGKPLTLEDIIFTIELIQSPLYKSPLRIEWLGIRVKTEGNNKVIFRLQKKYSSFLETVAHLKILPKHIFQDIPPENFPWAFVLKNYLIGSGPFKIKEIKEDKSGFIKKLTFERNEKFYDKKPFLKKISFYFYQNFDELTAAAKLGEIDGFSVSDPKYFNVLKKEGFNFYRIDLPRYFALFFNSKDSKILSQKIRKALSFAVNKEEILDRVFEGEGKVVNSPILADYFNFESPSQIFNFDIDKAKEILEEEGFKINPETGKREKVVVKKISLPFKRNLVYGSRGEDVRELQKCLAEDEEIYPEGEVTGYFGSKTRAAVIRFQEKYASEILFPIGLKKGTGDVKPMTREKLNKICVEQPEEIIPLKLALTTSDKFPLREIAEILKLNWQNIGADIEIKEVSLGEFQTNILAKRNFEMLLFGEALGSLPDPFSFWHSSQKDYPGLNITSYQSREADKLLEKARETLDETERKESLEKFQEVLLEDLPAIFLVRGDYFYFLSSKIKGYKVEKITKPSKRFMGIEDWFIKTKRAWK